MEERTERIPWKDIFLGFVVISFFLISPGLFPVFGDIVNLLTPAAILFFLVKLGRVYGLASNILALLFAASLWPGNGFLFEFLLLGAILFELLKKNFSAVKTVAYSTGLALFFFSAVLAVWMIQTGKDPGQSVKTIVDESLGSSMAFYRGLDLSASSMEALQNLVNDVRFVLVRYWFGFAAAFILMFVCLNVWAGGYVLARYNLPNFKFGKFSYWSLPENLVWVVIFAGLLTLLPFSGPQVTGISLLIFMGVIYFFQGIAIVSFYANKYEISTSLKVLIYFLISVQTYVIMLVAAAGLFDLWFDFRRLRKTDNDLNVA